MRHILNCRRTFIAVFAIAALTAISLYNNLDVAASIAAGAIGFAGGDSAEKVFKKD